MAARCCRLLADSSVALAVALLAAAPGFGRPLILDDPDLEHGRVEAQDPRKCLSHSSCPDNYMWKLNAASIICRASCTPLECCMPLTQKSSPQVLAQAAGDGDGQASSIQAAADDAREALWQQAVSRSNLAQTIMCADGVPQEVPQGPRRGPSCLISDALNSLEIQTRMQRQKLAMLDGPRGEAGGAGAGSARAKAVAEGGAVGNTDRKQAFREQGIIFLRVQKTGSTTFECVLQAQCNIFNITTCESYWHLDWRNVMLLRRLTPNRLVLTFLRDPLRRAISEAAFLRTQEEYGRQAQWDFSPTLSKYLDEWRAGGGSLANFAGIPNNPGNNRQTRYLAGFSRPRNICCIDNCDDTWNLYFSNNGTEPGVAMSQEDAQRTALMDAKSHLETGVDLFGLTECYHASMLLFQAELGWRNTPMEFFGKANLRSANFDYKSISPSDLKAMQDANNLDIQLYDFARQLLLKRFQEHGIQPYCQDALANNMLLR